MARDAERRFPRIRPPGPIRIDRVAREAAETRQQIAKARFIGGVAGYAGNDVCVPPCTARAARRSAITPHAPPIGSHSSMRGKSVTCG
jgi:hypothetical protein